MNYRLHKDNKFLANPISFELEFLHPGYSQREIRDFLNAEFPGFQIDYDGSLPNHGSEITMQKSMYDDFNIQLSDIDNVIGIWEKLILALQAKFDIQLQSNQYELGFHIHIDTKQMTPRNIYNIFASYHNFENYINLVHKGRENLQWVKSLSTPDIRKIKRIAKAHENKRDFIIALNSAFPSVRQRKYKTLSFNRLMDLGTIEFRKGGNGNIDYLRFWIKYVINFVKFNINDKKVKGFRTIKRYKVSQSSLSEFQRRFIQCYQFIGGNKSVFKSAIQHFRGVGMSDTPNDENKINWLIRNAYQEQKEKNKWS